MGLAFRDPVYTFRKMRGDLEQILDPPAFFRGPRHGEGELLFRIAVSWIFRSSKGEDCRPPAFSPPSVAAPVFFRFSPGPYTPASTCCPPCRAVRQFLFSRLRLGSSPTRAPLNLTPGSGHSLCPSFVAPPPSSFFSPLLNAADSLMIEIFFPPVSSVKGHLGMRASSV